MEAARFLARTYLDEINREQRQGHGKGEQGHGAAVPQGAFTMTDKAGNDPAQKTNAGANQEAVDVRQQSRGIQG